MKNKFSPYQLHPWHGIEIHSYSPSIVNAFIEIVPTDTVKYEIDKVSGHLKVDRPQLFSNVVPALYGFIPKTYCGDQIAEFCMKKTGRKDIKGDGDPIDILVLTEKEIPHGSILVQAIPIGGLRMIDKGEADDKIIAVLKDDVVFGKTTDIADLPQGLLDRLRHYFLTYKAIPGENRQVVEIDAIYGAKEAREVIGCSITDYESLLSN
ncbi:MAG TPA: inorganic pyrophosphatase [Flavobacteriales bacterium]|nr:inorganic pyrophosphatase [Flavobacteriales bacterium]HRE74845.1 inorganic pyrophosphatase [Flavobacteriales bacterium]HRJ37069.1 inorganic pyrophosphatase [Flavobacteriales bacterium]HRJ37931.1 inorganic pyrophosphatase [Flavobacteriales bacterium]